MEEANLEGMATIKIPLFTVLKNDSILKNLFLNLPPPLLNKCSSGDDDEAEKKEVKLLVGRHPDCQIVLDHPSISRFHLEIFLRPTLQKLAVIDLSSVHGTWVSGERVEARVPRELVEGDELILGASTRVYRLQWVSLADAYEIEYPPKVSNQCLRENKEIHPDENSNRLPDKENSAGIGAQIPSAPPLPPEFLNEFAAKMFVNQEGGNLREAAGENRSPPIWDQKDISVTDSVSYSLSMKLCSDASFQLEMKAGSPEDSCVFKQLTTSEGVDFLSEMPFMPEYSGDKIEDRENAGPASGILGQIDAPLSGFGCSSLPRRLFTENDPPQKNSEDLISEQVVSPERVRNATEMPMKLDQSNQKEVEGENPSPASRILGQREISAAESVCSSLPDNVLSEANSQLEKLEASPDVLVLKQVLAEKEEQSPPRSLQQRGSSTLWSRRCKSASFIKVQTERSGTKMATGVRNESRKENDENSGIDTADKKEKSFCKVLFSGLDMEEESFISDKENMTPEIGGSSIFKVEQKVNFHLQHTKHMEFINSPSSFATVSLDMEEELFSSDKENKTPSISQSRKTKMGINENQNKPSLEKAKNRKADRVPFQSLSLNSKSKSRSTSILNTARKTFNSNNCAENRVDSHSDANHSVDQSVPKGGVYKKRWNMVVDTSCLLDEESIKSLKLLEGLKGTRLNIPRMVIRELDCLKRKGSWFRKEEQASSLLQWIEDCMVKASWWMHVQSSAESSPVPPTPPASPRSWLSDGNNDLGSLTTNSLPFSKCGSFVEIVSPTAGDHILDCALHLRKIKNDGQIVLLTNDIALKIKAMAEGLICETAKEFRESLVNPYSERFLWADSSPRGLIWSSLDEVAALKENYSHFWPNGRKTTKVGESAKGLKLILLHNSHYGQSVHVI